MPALLILVPSGGTSGRSYGWGEVGEFVKSGVIGCPGVSERVSHQCAFNKTEDEVSISG